MADVRAEGDRSVAAQTISGLVISGDHNQVFQGDYAQLGDVYLNHDSVFQRLDVDHFIGRDALIRDIDAFIARERCGYIVIEAEAGLGKSALLGALVRRRGYIHHFVELTGPQGTDLALKSLAAQIIRAYDLGLGVVPAAAARPQYFHSLLGQASARAGATGERVVVVIDGLDQAAAPEDHNVLGLPTSLPNGVFLIVSHQPVAIALRAPDVPRRVLSLTAQSKENLDDMRHYLEAAADRLGVSRYGFVEPLLRKCDGRWQQMVLIVREIASGARSPSDLDTIPNGLTQEYCARYRRYGDSMPDDRWTAIHRPLLAAIAAAEEPVSIAMLSAWTERTVTGSDLAPLLRGGSHGLLVVDHQQQLTRYRPEHVSVRDFLNGRVDRNALTSSELATLDEAVEATRAGHDHLASFYLRRFDASTRDENIALDDYGLTHVITHLEQAHRHADAIALLSRERVAQQRVRARAVSWLPVTLSKTVETRTHLWTELRTQRGTWVDVASDIKRLWTIEDQRLDQLPAPDLRAPLRFALLHASMMGRINSITPTLASELVRLGVWSPQQCLAFGLTTRPGRWNRHALLTALGEALAARGHVDEALAAVYMIDVGVDQAKALSKIVKLLPDRLTGTLLDRLRLLVELPIDHMTGMRAEVERSPYGVASIPADVVAGLAPGLSAEAAAKAIDIVRPLPPLSRVFAWAPLFDRLTLAARSALIDEALATARSIDDEHERMLALARVAADLPHDERRRAVDEVVPAIESEQDVGRRSALIDLVRSALLRTWPPERVFALLERAPSVDEQLTAILTRERHPDRYFVRAAVERARAGSSFGRWYVLAAASPYLDSSERDEALALARHEELDWLGLDLIAPLPEANRLTSHQWIVEQLGKRARAMNTNAPMAYLARLAALGQVDTALTLTRSIGLAHARGQTLAALVRYVPMDQQRPLLDEALSLVCSTEDEDQRRAVEAACEAERGQSRQALTLLTKSRVHMHAEFLADLVDRLVDRGEPELAVDALIATSDFLSTRLEALSQIADRIPEPLLQRALTAWHDERDRRNGLTAHAIVAAHTTGAGATDALFAIEDAGDRARALTLVIRHLPPSQVALVLDRVLTAAGDSRVPLVNVSTALVAALVPRLSDAPSLRRLLQVVWGSPEIEHRDKSAAIVAMRLIEQEHPRDLESLAAAVGTLRTQRQVLDRIASFITDEAVLELLATRESWIHDSDWAPAIADLAAFFARRGQSGVAVALVNAIDTRYRTNSALALVGLLPGGEFAVFWKAILRDVCENSDWIKRPAQLRALVPVLRQFPTTTLDVVLRTMLHELALRPRDAFLKDLRALLPIVAIVGGDDALQAIIQGCADVGRWFP